MYNGIPKRHCLTDKLVTISIIQYTYTDQSEGQNTKNENEVKGYGEKLQMQNLQQGIYITYL